MTGTIRILLVDDHPVVRQGLRDMFARCPDMQVVGDAEDGSSALEAARRLRPDVILLDVRMPKAIGVRMIKELRKVAEGVRIIMLTAFDDNEYLFGALRDGADGYLLKTVSSDELVKAIRLVRDGERVISPGLSGRVIERVRILEQERRIREVGLSALDVELLECIAEGLTTPEIAKRVYVSEITVKRRISEILEKLGAKHRAHAVSEAMRRGLI